MDTREGLAKQLCSSLNMISRDDFLHDNDSSNDSAAVTKGLESLIKEQSQSTLGIFFFFFLAHPPRTSPSAGVRTYLSLKQLKSDCYI